MRGRWVSDSSHVTLVRLTRRHSGSHLRKLLALTLWSHIGTSFQRKLSLSLVYSKPRIIRNPTIEEQALARIHRIGQTREVTTVRFYIRESFEERVMETQEFKKNLAGVLLSGHDGGQADDSLGALQVCFPMEMLLMTNVANTLPEIEVFTLAKAMAVTR